MRAPEAPIALSELTSVTDRRLLISFSCLGSAQSCDEINGSQVRVTLKHPELFVSADGAHLGDVEALLKKTRNRLVSKVVEMQVVQACARSEMLKGQADRVARHREDT